MQSLFTLLKWKIHLVTHNHSDEIDPIANPTTYSNIELGQQTIYVRVTNDTTGCFTIVCLQHLVWCDLVMHY